MAAITISITTTNVGQDEVQTANARDLHRELGVGKDFSTWVKAQIERASLVENEDFVVLTQKGENLSGGRPTVDYHLTFESAKHIAMMSGTPKGKEVRKYFIECERQAHAASQQPQQLNPANFTRLQLIELAMQAEQERIESEHKRLALEVKVEAMAPQVEALERIARSEGSLCITDAAKTLQVAPRELAKLLHEWHWTYRRPMGAGWLAHQDRIRSGHMEHKVTTGEKGDGSEWSNTQARITPKGLTRLAELLAKRQNIMSMN